jgi:hypothetical protein
VAHLLSGAGKSGEGQYAESLAHDLRILAQTFPEPKGKKGPPALRVIEGGLAGRDHEDREQ